MKCFLLLVPFLAMGSALDAESAGKEIFMANCVPCHGVTGRGDGKLAAGLATRPADLTRIASRRGGVWPMLEVMGILDGYYKGTLSREDMAVFENLLDNEMTEIDSGNGMDILAPKKLIDVVYYLESLQDPAPTSYVP